MNESENSIYVANEEVRLDEPYDGWMIPMFTTEKEISKWEKEQRRRMKMYRK